MAHHILTGHMDMKMNRARPNRMAIQLNSAVLAGMLLLFDPITGIGQQQPTISPTAPAPVALTIGSGDLVDVMMYDAPELSGKFRVDEKGDVDMPLLGLIHVQGLTAEQTEKLIESRYVAAEILRPDAAQSTVFIEEYASQGITVTGQVKNPGVYPALGVRMLNDVVTAAGGVTNMASSDLVVTHRNDPQHPITVEYSPEAVNPVIPALQILPGDTIMVPRAGVVYVAGNVAKPGVYVLDGRDTLTIEEAMALSGGSGHAANLRHVQIVRKRPGNRKEMIIVPVDQIYKGKAPDVKLNDGDIVYVPTSNGKLVTLQAIQSAIGMGTSVVIYRAAY